VRSIAARDDLDNVAARSDIPFVKTAGRRERKNRLRGYGREVQSGEAMLATDPGEVVAGLVPSGQGPGRQQLGSGLQPSS
jgi:antitoxin (DNA-binding transcriptional repressor) of toxin-antitoxin stability system